MADSGKPNAAVSVDDAVDDRYLESLGYKQELKRDMTFWGSVGITIGCMQPLLSAGVFQLGMLYGGPATVVYGFILCFVFGSPMAISMAEISAPFVTAGGPYYWSGALAGRLGKLPSFVVGYLILLSFMAGGCSIILAGVQQCVSMHMMMVYGFDTQKGSPALSQNNQFLAGIAFCLVGAITSALPMKYLNNVARGSFAWLIMATIAIVVVIPIAAKGFPNDTSASVCNPWGLPCSQHARLTSQNSSYVFRTNTFEKNAEANGVTLSVQDGGPGFHKQSSINGFTFCNGLLMAQYLILVFDVPGHMAEETQKASYTVPRAILTSYFLGSALNFALLLTFLFSVTNVNNAAVPGFGITSTCQTVNGGPFNNDTSGVFGFGDLPPFSTNKFPGLPNDGIPLNAFAGGCVLSNGFPFSYMPVGNIFYDAFAAKLPMCTPDVAYGPATWDFDVNGTLFDTGVVGKNTVYNSFNCLPLNMPGGCCDMTGNIAPTKTGRNAAMFFVFLIFGGVAFSNVLNFIAASRFIYSFARDGGFPGPLSRLLAYVEPRSGSPIFSIVFFFGFVVAFSSSWTNKSPTVAFNAVSGLNAIAFLTVYGTPCLLRVTTALGKFVPSPDFNLRSLSIPMAVIGAAYGAFSVGTISIPNFYPLTPNTVNYAPIALAAVIIMSLLLFPFAMMPFWAYQGPALKEHRDGGLYPSEETMKEGHANLMATHPAKCTEAEALSNPAKVAEAEKAPFGVGRPDGEYFDTAKDGRAVV